MPLARTTFRPDLVFNMDQAEFDALLSAHLLYVDWRTLYVNFRVYSDGPPAIVTGVAVTIKDGSNNTVQAASGSAIQQVDVGSYLYRWSNASVPGSGTYAVTWTALDADSVTCTATDTVTV
jgi:hypothetical protein